MKKENYKGELGIGYDTIIERDLIVQVFLTTDFKHQFLQWYDATVPMKEPISLLRKSYLNKREIHGVVIQTAEPASTREATEILEKILDSSYSKSAFNR